MFVPHGCQNSSYKLPSVDWFPFPNYQTLSSQLHFFRESPYSSSWFHPSLLLSLLSEGHGSPEFLTGQLCLLFLRTHSSP